MKRFDLLIDGPVNRDYCDEGEYVDADIAQELYDALKMLVDNGGIGPESMLHDARDALAKAKGEQQ